MEGESVEKPSKMETPQSSEQLELDVETIKKKATLLLLQGKRSIYIRDYQAALVALSESCQLFSQIYPEQDAALADPYFYYGKALLEIGRNESDVLGDQVQDESGSGDDDDDDDDEEDEENGDEDEDDEKDEDDAGKENNERGNEEKEGDVKSETEKNGNCSNDENERSISQKKESECTEKPNQGTQNTDDANGEINDLQLSWEYLELAKLIYLKKADTCKDTAIKLAETYLCLGENGLESENYSIAIEDIKQALELQKKHLNVEDRRIAETYYQLGVAHSLDQNYDEAIKSFNNAIEQLGKKISSLEIRKKTGDKKTEEEEKDAFYTMEGEIDEIKGVIKDIEEKIKDMMESKNKVKAELMKQVFEGGQKSSDDSGAGSSSAPATDISHLIKRKRKNEENNSGDEKKLKTDN